MIQDLPINLIDNSNYIVRFARDREEVKEAQRLRFEVFNIELGEGLETSYDEQLDRDKYDDQFNHLLVIEKDSSDVIGTYRMQTHDIAKKKLGFYSENEFDLSEIPPETLAKSVEVGRACIAKEHRNGRVLYLLWRGLARYMLHEKCRYLFGCCSITSQDENLAWIVMEYLKQNGHIHDSIIVPVKENFRCEPFTVKNEAWKQVELPQLFRLYMDLGAKVCSHPAIDRKFKTIDYLVILDIEALDERMRMLFFK